MNDRVFIDTNIFVYAYLENYKNKSDYAKHLKAKELLQSFQKGAFVCISTQVCNEYYSALLKNRIEDQHIQSSLKSLILSTNVTSISKNTVLQSFEIRNRYGFSYWDSLILSSALENECTVLYSEDMQDEQVLNGVLRVVNPFG
ncbi:MAG TPA: PIN domain-containing protein [Campylobacterales bacterium]|nr:PIN domain-containing protein [Campylobacterales bacterium]